MQIQVADSYEAMSTLAANDLVVITQLLQKPLISPASGDSPAGLYKELANRSCRNQIDTSAWHFVALDEWVGMNGNDEGSCRFYLDQQLFGPLAVQDERIAFFDGRSKELSSECEKVETFIQQHGGIDIAIVGLGLNGHIGMNEPGTPVSIRSHVGELHPLTAQVGQKYFKEERKLSAGITLGLANILEAKNIFLLVSGSKKAGIVNQMLTGEISEHLPATLILAHPGLKIYLDREAAALIDDDLYGK